MTLRKVDVVAAVFFRTEKSEFQIALFQRKSGDSGAGLWEFPGGKVESDETYEGALQREIVEELSLEVEVLELLGRASHVYPSIEIDLSAYWVKSDHFNWQLNDHDGVVWVSEQTWKNWALSPIDFELIQKAFAQGGPLRTFP